MLEFWGLQNIYNSNRWIHDHN